MMQVWAGRRHLLPTTENPACYVVRHGEHWARRQPDNS
jgi:hypothetical protein